MDQLNNSTGSDISQFTFDTIDYIVFVFMLSISAVIGAYFGFFAKGADTTDEYLMGGKAMKTVPIAISLVASQLSGISIMTIPAEMYAFGVNWSFNVLPMVIIVPILCWIVIPVFYNNNISNCYEYLQLRFNRSTRELLTIAFMTTIFFMLPVFIFIPALAFSQVTGINIHLINAIVCSICISYTMFGGIKAVVWTDVIQGAIMVVSVVLVALLGAWKIGGLGEVLRLAADGGRLDIDYTFDATTRSTFWNCSVNAIIVWVAYVGLNQSCVQRIVSLPTLGHAQRSLFIFGAGFMLIMVFNCFTGIVMFTRYHDCDPLTAGYVEKPDKLMPFFVQDVVGHLRGMPGVFISCVFSAALSTMSASMNSLSGVVYFDYIKPYIRHTDQRANLIMKAIVLACGIYCIIGGFAVEKFTSILQLGYSIGGVTFGAVFGVFMLGMLVPRAHGRAALWAVVCSMTTMFIIVVGAQGRLHYKPLPLSVESCPAHNVTTTMSHPNSTLMELVTDDASESQSFSIFEISFQWYATLGTMITLVLGIALSYILAPEKGTKFDRKLLSPLVQPFAKYELTHVQELPEILTEKPESKSIPQTSQN